LGVAFLAYRDARDREQLYELGDTATRKLIIGRGMEADIPLTWDSEVSSVHAELERIGDSWAIIDDGLSSNGTYVNGERLNGRRRLHDGDALRVGQTVVTYRARQDPDTRTRLSS
jgi:pSer/pThr/pTyr-binding forkhead associated (FHA) protein